MILRDPAARAVLGLLLAASSLASPLSDQERKPPQPTVQPPVPPRETGQDLRKLPPAEPWKPGDPVREVPDLRHTETSPTRSPVVPQVLTVDLRRLPVLTRDLFTTAQGRPIRIVLPEGPSAGRYALQGADGAFAVTEISGDSAGALVAGPLAFESLWRDAGACRAGGDQELTIRHDRRAARWLLSRWASPAPGSSFLLCVALSRTSDPIAGGWTLYDFQLPIYRAGAGLEVAENAYVLVIDLGGAQALFAFDRTRMLEGAPVEPRRALPDPLRPAASPARDGEKP